MEAKTAQVLSKDKTRKIAEQVCPQCGKQFELNWDDFGTLKVRSCPSGGVYDVTIECPNCDYEEPL